MTHIYYTCGIPETVGVYNLFSLHEDSPSQSYTFNNSDKVELSPCLSYVVRITVLLTLQSQKLPSGSSPEFFREDETYWRPSNVESELYEQLSTRKYREILRHQIE